MASPKIGLQLNYNWVTSWRGSWAAGEYIPGQIVTDAGYLMVCETKTTDRAAPQPEGDPVYGYSGANPTTSASAKQILQGKRYTPTTDVFISGYRVYGFSGEQYRIFLVNDAGQVSEVFSFVAATTGWQEFPLAQTIVPAGQTFDLVAATTEPDPTPTIWSGNWSYQTPQNPTIPTIGQISHSRANPTLISVSKTDNDAGDRGAELLALNLGDIIDGAGIRWSIQGLTDQGGYVDFSVSPAQNGSPVGVQIFQFETVTATPIEYLEDVGYYTGGQVQGLLAIDAPFSSIVPDSNQYGIDILTQPAYISPDWGVMAYTG